MAGHVTNVADFVQSTKRFAKRGEALMRWCVSSISKGRCKGVVHKLWKVALLSFLCTLVLNNVAWAAKPWARPRPVASNKSDPHKGAWSYEVHYREVGAPDMELFQPSIAESRLCRAQNELVAESKTRISVLWSIWVDFLRVILR